MIDRLGPGQRRALAVSILAAIVLLAASLTILPAWIVNSAYRAQVETLQAQLSQYQLIASSEPALRRRHAEILGAQAIRSLFMSGKSEATAAAELQQVVKDVTVKHDTQLISTQILPVESADGMQRIGLRIRILGPFQGIVGAAYDLETSRSALFIDNLALRKLIGPRQTITESGLDRFEANFDLIAYIQDLK